MLALAVALSVANNVIASVRNIAVELKVGVQVVFHHLKQTTLWQKPCEMRETEFYPISRLGRLGILGRVPAFATVSDRRSCYRSYRRRS